MSENRNSFENLTHSGIMRVNSKDDRNISLSLNAFGGSTNFSVFAGGGGKPWSVTLKRRSIANIIILLRNMQNNVQPCREMIMIKQYDPEAKRSKEIGSIAFGIDENLTFQIEVAGDGLNGRHIFPIRNDLGLDFSNTSMSEKDIVKGAIETLIDALSLSSVVAERLTSQKRQFSGGGGGGNRGNFGGGNRSGGGGYNNNGGGNRQGNSTFGGSEGVSDGDISY